MLVVRIMQEQGLHVEALNFQTTFTCCRDDAGRAARELGVRLTVLSAQDDYLDLIRRPRFGVGRGANPCVDCRIYMFERAVDFMNQVGAKFIVSGEVLGQRPMSQKRKDLDTISHQSGLDDLLLRPLSAKKMAPTLPEREGWVNRDKLYAFVGRGRKQLIALAHEMGLRSIPDPSTGCALTEPQFSLKVHDLVQLDPHSVTWDFDLLKIGRHYRIDNRRKVIVGRSDDENARLRYAQRTCPGERATLVEPDNFAGPAAMLIGPSTDEAIDLAAALLLKYAPRHIAGEARVCVTSGGQRSTRDARLSDLASSLVSITKKCQPKPGGGRKLSRDRHQPNQA